MGQAQRALVRLLGEATRHGNDPELFAGLVHACRYCGLFEAVDRGACRGAPARSERSDERRADAADDRGHRSPPGRSSRRRSSRAPTTASGSSPSAWPGAATRRGGRCRCARPHAFRRCSRGPSHLMAWLDRRPADMIVGIAALSASEDSGRPGGDLPGGMAALRCRRARTGTRPASARGRQRLRRGPDSCRQPAIRRDAERSRVSGAARASGSEPPGCAGGVPRGRRRTAPRLVSDQRHERVDARSVERQRGGMKTLARHRDKAEILQRLRAVRPDSVRRWGRMSAHQMVCHLSDSFRMVLGQKPVCDATGRLQRTIVKWIALYLPLPWPAGIPTRPELDQELGGTRPVDFAADVAELEALLDRVTTQKEACRRAIASDFRQDVGGRLAPLGLPAHGPPSSPVRQLELDTAAALRRASRRRHARRALDPGTRRAPS